MGLFSTLNTGTSGLNAAQVAVATTSHNISNVDKEFYTRQRVSLAARDAHNTQGVSVGLGVRVHSVVRLHDEFVFTKLRNAATDLSYSDFSTKTLQEAAQYFPDLKDAGIAQDLIDYFKEWNNLSSNAKEGSQKISLVQSAVTLTSDIKSTRDSMRRLQDSINTQLKSAVDEVNSIGEKMVAINKQIALIESEKYNNANDLRDQRDELELTLSKLIGFSVSKGELISDSSHEAGLTDSGKDYHLNIVGGSFVDGITFHPITIDSLSNATGYFSLYSQMQDGRKFNITEQASGGKIGAMLDLRGRQIFANANEGYPKDGLIQGYVNKLDSFAQTLITETNNIYAVSARDSLRSPTLELKEDTALKNAFNNIEKGTFDIIVYDNAGNEVARKNIKIDSATSMNDDTFSTSILTQINTSSDDNKDNNALNDVDDYFRASFMSDGTFSLSPTAINNGYKVAIKDYGTNFAGVIGVSQFFTGTDARDIDVLRDYKENPSSMQASAAPIVGNREVANAMLQLQFNSLTFYDKNGTTELNTISAFYSGITTHIATDASAATSTKDTNKVLYNSVYAQFQSVSGVNKDEELAALIKYQSSYAAAAKIITTVDAMLNTLLGIKQ